MCAAGMLITFIEGGGHVDNMPSLNEWWSHGFKQGISVQH